MMEALDLTTEMSERMLPYRKLFNILSVFIPAATDFFGSPEKIGDVDVIFAASKEVRSTITRAIYIYIYTYICIHGYTYMYMYR